MIQAAPAPTGQVQHTITRKVGWAGEAAGDASVARLVLNMGSCRPASTGKHARVRARCRMGDNNASRNRKTADELISCRLIDVSQELQLSRKTGRGSIAYLPLTQPGQENPSSANLCNLVREKAFVLKGLQET